MTIDEGMYKLVIIGGGPAGLGVFIRAARTGFLPRLLDPVLHGKQQDLACSERCGRKQKGVAILHDGDASTFGSGKLGQYVINSNTFAKSLLSSVLDEKPDLDPPESTKGTFLEKAREHESTQRLEQIGLAPVCLKEMGNFLNYLGECALNELTAHDDTSKALLHTRATKFEVLENGVIRVEAQSMRETVVLYTEHLALAMGGKQEAPPLENPVLASKLFTSETCLRDDGFALLREHLLQSAGRKVCIVGGSHSSFSVAWMLLNKFRTKVHPSSRAKSNPLPASAHEATLSAVQDQNEPESAAGPVSESPEASSPTKHTSGPLKELVIMPVVPVQSPPLPEKLDSVSKLTTKIQSSSDPFAVFKPKDITILHRTPIRCYYASKKDAETDGVDSSHADRSGCINTFTGLREDSKVLFKDIKSGKETRVRLFHVNQHGCQNLTTKAYESASVIVWCCGYKTRMIPAFDADGKPIKFYEEHGVVKLDLQAHLQVQQQHASSSAKTTIVPLTNILGLGLGFSLRSAVDEMGTETRADGVTVYHRRGATLALAALFGDEVFGTSRSFEEMVEKNDKKKRDTQAAKAEATALVDKVKSSGSSGRSSSKFLSCHTGATHQVSECVKSLRTTRLQW
uniref:Uncharacterized protein n=1 Tax=Globisporangium ultimum (strain ATCC 200006 / CBS 805.95 / DAOM BR144) TaxID=431595 RepID=K3WPW6_GLOUD